MHPACVSLELYFSRATRYTPNARTRLLVGFSLAPSLFPSLYALRGIIIHVEPPST